MSRDGTRLAVALGVRLRVFRIADLSLVHELPRCVKWEVRGATKGAAQTVVDGQAVWLAQADEPLWQARHARGHGELGALAPTSPRAELRAAVLLDHDNGPDVLTLRVPGREPLALHEPPGHCVGSACDPTGRYAALAYADGTLRVCDFERRSWVATIHTGQELRGCAWLDEGRRLVAFSTLGPLWLRWCASARDE